MSKQNILFLILSFVVVLFILLVGVFLAEKMLMFAFLSLVIAFAFMGFGFYLKRKWNTQ